MQVYIHDGHETFPHGAGPGKAGWYVYRVANEPDGPFDTAGEARMHAIRCMFRDAPVQTSRTISRALQVSERTAYRYIAKLRKQGHCILGGSGFGYLWRN